MINIFILFVELALFVLLLNLIAYVCFLIVIDIPYQKKQKQQQLKNKIKITTIEEL